MAALWFSAKGKSDNLLKICRYFAVRRAQYSQLEPSLPIKGKEPKWVTACEAMEALQSDQTIFVQGAASTPNVLLDAMTEKGKQNKLKNITVCHMHTEGPGSYCDPSCEGIFRSLSFFMASNVRKAVAEGRGDSIPIFLHEIPYLFTRKIICPDIALLNVSPPDEHGYCSLGTSVDCTRAALMNSKMVIAQINPCVPRTFGDSAVHYSHFDYAVKCNVPLAAHPASPPSGPEIAIAKIIADNLVEDGATLQMGIGNIPDATLAALKDHKNLGIHSEMIAGGVIDLIASGSVTNALKPQHKGKIVSSFLNGTQALYDFADNNPALEMLRVDYVNDPKVICTQPKMTAINSAIEVDLTGQVNADSIGTRMFSGFGGQVDFIRGSAEGLDGKGKPIIAFQSVTKKKVSKIVPILKPGAGVVTSRAHVQYVVTEYGVAHLFGRSLRQRAYALIQIAHPEHRESLEKAAFERLKCMPCK